MTHGVGMSDTPGGMSECEIPEPCFEPAASPLWSFMHIVHAGEAAKHEIASKIMMVSAAIVVCADACA